ncbi:hypothetical protein FQN49_003994 [Arthroderma sp. PD_2]|nr:hypothetical protein FQN49_003994 [Arthroderma sp. PD_2]
MDNNFPPLDPSNQAAGGRSAQAGRYHQPSPPNQQQQQQQQPQILPASAIPILEPQGPPQLPPQLFTTAAQLLDLTDSEIPALLQKLVLVLRDGRKLIGVLRSWDQFANIVLQDTIERIYAENLYADIPRGVYLIRGENVLLLGEIDLDKDDDVPEPYRLAPALEVQELKKKAEEQRKRKDKKRNTHMQTLGFEPEHSGEILF